MLETGTDRVVHGRGPLYLARADGSTIRLVRDALGSVRAELNDLGIVTKAFRYAAYGAISDRAPLGATPTLLGFTGELANPSGLTYLRARWHDSAAGRFLSRDPFHGLATTPTSLNRYGYVDGNPVSFADPTGHCPWCVVAGAVIGGTASLAGYAVTARVTWRQFDPGQAALAFGAGAITGAVCGAALFVPCLATGATASVVQYHFSPGDKSALGYAAAAVTGAAAGRYTVGRILPHYAYSPQLMRNVQWAIRNDAALKIGANFLRSLVATGLTSLGQSVSANTPEENK